MGIEEDLYAARVIGLSEQAACAYAKLLARERVALQQASLNELLRSALITRNGDTNVLLDPEPALDTAKYRTLNRAQAARSTVAEAFRRAKAPGVQPRVGHIRTLSPQQALGAVRRRLIAVGAPPGELALVEDVPAAPGWSGRVAGLRRLAAAGARVRVVYRGDPADVLASAHDELVALVDGGVEVRVGRGSGAGVLLADHDIGWMWSTGSDESVEVTVPTLLVVAEALFEALWAESTEVITRVESPPTTAQVLGGLAAGLSDEQIARLLGISPRTLSRRITAMLADTACTTRFQLAAHAVEKGWLR